MEIKVFPDVPSFLDGVQPYLERDEAWNNLLLGLALAAKRDPAGQEVPCMLTAVVEAGETQAVAWKVPVRNLLLAAPEGGKPEFIHALAASLHDRGLVVQGITAGAGVAETFAQDWLAFTGQSWRLEGRMGVYELQRVIPPELASGHLRAAEPGDRELVAGWWHAFQLEVFATDDAEGARRSSGSRLAGGDVWLWEDGGRPVCMTARVRRLPHGSAVGYVYTPKEDRRRGYASVAVAEQSRLMLEGGDRFCCLFTDLDNATTNHIYRQIGYEYLGDFADLRFEDT